MNRFPFNAATVMALLAVPRTRGDEPQDCPAHAAPVALFPAHAGMNRVGLIRKLNLKSTVPRTRGDEPAGLRGSHAYFPLFPAHAGMNRQIHANAGFSAGTVPRTRGDEPTIL